MGQKSNKDKKQNKKPPILRSENRAWYTKYFGCYEKPDLNPLVFVQMLTQSINCAEDLQTEMQLVLGSLCSAYQ